MFPFYQPPKKQNFIPPHFPNPHSNHLLSFFKTNDGQWDFNKVSNSLSQMNQLVKQAEPLIKQFSSFIKK